MTDRRARARPRASMTEGAGFGRDGMGPNATRERTDAVDFPLVSHPTLGLPPRSLQAGFPDAGARLKAQRAALAARALEVAVDADPTIRTRFDDVGLRNLVKDAQVHVDRVALCVAGNDSHWLKEFADQAAPVFRRREVPMDDVCRILEGLRTAARGVLSEEEMVPADAALDEAVKVYRWYRRLSGDARKKNPIIETIYRGI